MCTGLTLTQAEPRRPASYGASIDFTTTPSWPRARASRTKAAATSGSSVVTLGVRCRSGTSSVSAAQRSVPGRSRRLVPSRWSRSKKYGVTWTPLSMAVRDAVSWKGRGRPSSVRASASPSSTNRSAGRRSRHLDDLGQPVGDHVERAGGDDHVVAVLVDLDPDAVELGVDRDRVHRRPWPSPRPRRARWRRASAAPAGRPRARSRRARPRPRTPPGRSAPCRPRASRRGVRPSAARRSRPPGLPGRARRGRPGGRCR